jgi:hypothetical protein
MGRAKATMGNTHGLRRFCRPRFEVVAWLAAESSTDYGGQRNGIDQRSAKSGAAASR